MPRLSILIPTFARRECLADCVDAALATTNDADEILVGDDGVFGALVCADRATPRLRYICNLKRLGMAGNWNALLDAAQGEFLALCMDDDVLAPEFASRCLAEFGRDPDLDVVFTNHRFRSAERTWTRDCALSPGRHDSFTETFLRLKPVAVSAAIIRREAWLAVRPLPDTAAADMVLFGRLAECGSPFFYLDEPLMTYHVHGDQLSGTDGFRSECVAAWASLRFSDAASERLRRRLLGDALLSRARMHVQHGDGPSARRDVRRALRTGTREPVTSVAVTAAAARLPVVARWLLRRAAT